MRTTVSRRVAPPPCLRRDCTRECVRRGPIAPPLPTLCMCTWRRSMAALGPAQDMTCVRLPHATCDVPHATCDAPLATCNAPHATCDAQHATHPCFGPAQDMGAYGCALLLSGSWFDCTAAARALSATHLFRSTIQVLAPAAVTPAPGLGSPLRHLHRDWAHPATSAAGLGSTRLPCAARVQMWLHVARAWSRCRSGRGEPQVPVQMWQG